MKDNLVRRSPIDPAVADLLGGMERRQEERQMTRRERDKKAKARKKLADRNRLMVDLPKDVNARIEEIAKEQGVSVSGVVALACLRLINADAAGHVDWTAYKQPTKSPRFDWRLEIPPVDD